MAKRPASRLPCPRTTKSAPTDGPTRTIKRTAPCKLSACVDRLGGRTGGSRFAYQAHAVAALPAMIARSKRVAEAWTRRRKWQYGAGLIDHHRRSAPARARRVLGWMGLARVVPGRNNHAGLCLAQHLVRSPLARPIGCRRGALESRSDRRSAVSSGKLPQPVHSAARHAPSHRTPGRESATSRSHRRAAVDRRLPDLAALDLCNNVVLVVAFEPVCAL